MSALRRLPPDAGALLMLALAETIVWASLFYTFPILLLRWEAEFGWPREDVALGLTSALAASALASPLAGRLIDRGLMRWVAPLAALGGGALLAGLTFVETRAAFLAVWALIGVACAGCLYEPCFAFLTRVKGEGARGAITAVTLIAGFASTICFPIADALAEAHGWRVAVMAFAAASGLVAAPLFAISAMRLEAAAPDTSRGTSAAAGVAARRAWRRPAFWLLAAAFPTVAITHGMMISHLLPIFADRGAAGGVAVFAASLIGPAQVAGRVFITVAARRRSPVAVTLVAFCGIALAALTLLGWSGAPGVFAFVLLLGASYGVISITKPLVTADLLGRAGFGAIAGALATPYIAALAAAPFLAGLMWRRAGYDLVLGVTAGLAAIGFALILLAARASREIDPGTRPR